MGNMLKYLMGGRAIGLLTNVLIWGAHIPTNHYQMNKTFKYTIKSLLSAGFVGCDPSTKNLDIYGLSESLNVKTTELGMARFSTLLGAGQFYRVILKVGDHYFPALFITDQDMCPFEDHKLISKDEAYDSLLEIITSTFQIEKHLPIDQSFIE